MGVNILITSGGTAEAIDSVRTITNMSTGKLGAQIYDEFVEQLGENLGKIFYVCANRTILPKAVDKGKVVYITGVQSMLDAVEEILKNETIDIMVHAAAVSDYSVSKVSSQAIMAAEISEAVVKAFKEGYCKKRIEEIIVETLKNGGSIDRSSKISSKEQGMMVFLEQTPKIIERIKKIQPHVFLVGFKLLNGVPREHLFDVGFELLRKNRCNLVLANDLARIREGDHTGLLIFPEKSCEVIHGKDSIARELVRTALRRGNTRYITSEGFIQNEEDISDETFLAMRSAGQKLAAGNFLPVVEGGTYGNMSMLDEYGMVITGRNVNKGDLQKESLVRVWSVIESKGENVYAQVKYCGFVKPSIDSAIHGFLYKSTGCKAIMHIHTDEVFAGIPMVENFACGTEAECRGIISAFERDAAAKAVQIYNHGIVAIGDSLDECMETIQGIFDNYVSIHRIKSMDDDAVFDDWIVHTREVEGVVSELPFLNPDYGFAVSHKGTNKGVLMLNRQGLNTAVFTVYLKPEYRADGNGTGSRVIELAFELCRIYGINELRIETADGCGVVEYYTTRHGFEVVGKKEKMTYLRKML